MGNVQEKEGGVSERAPKDKKEMLKKRTTVAEEILSTEETYVKNLQVLCEIYIRPLEAKRIISNKKVAVIFPNVNTLYEVHLEFLHDLQDRMRIWNDKQKLGDVFIKHADMFKTYTTYVNNYNNAMDTINELQDSKAFQKFLEEAQSHPSSQRLDLSSLLIMPIQRLPRYVMLLAELQKRTPKKHPDSKPLTEATLAIGHVTNYINEEKRHAEQLNEMLSLQSRFTTRDVHLAIPKRHLIAQVPSLYRRVHTHTTVYSERSSSGRSNGGGGGGGSSRKSTVKPWKKAMVLLFNDSIVVAQPASAALLVRSRSIFSSKEGALKMIACDFLPSVNLFQMDEAIHDSPFSLLLEFNDGSDSYHLKLQNEEEIALCVETFNSTKLKARGLKYISIWEKKKKESSLKKSSGALKGSSGEKKGSSGMPKKKGSSGEKKGSSGIVSKKGSSGEKKGSSGITSSQKKEKEPVRKVVTTAKKKPPPPKKSKSSDGKTKSLWGNAWGEEEKKKKKKKKSGPSKAEVAKKSMYKPVGVAKKSTGAAKDGVSKKMDAAKNKANKGKDKITDKTPLLGRKKKKKVCGCCVVS